MRVVYRLARDAWSEFPLKVEELALGRQLRVIADIGGGANPAVEESVVREHQLDYTVFDVSLEELSKAPSCYRTRVLDEAQVPSDLVGQFDLIISRMTAEHVTDARQFHQNMFAMLRPGGFALHFFPTLYSAPFVFNRMVPEWLTERILGWMQPHRIPSGAHGKFPAYYRWCRGPSRLQQRRFESVGFRVEEYVGYYGHSGNATAGPGYLDRVPVLCSLHERLAEHLVRHPVSLLTTYASLLLEKPSVAELRQAA